MYQDEAETAKPDVTVSVVGSQIVCEPDVYAPPKGGGKLIVWVLDDAAAKSWRFAQDGIAIKDKNDQFSGPGVVAKGLRFKIQDKNSDLSTYAYMVNLVDPQTGKTLSLDPAIKNTGQ